MRALFFRNRFGFLGFLLPLSLLLVFGCSQDGEEQSSSPPGRKATSPTKVAKAQSSKAKVYTGLVSFDDRRFDVMGCPSSSEHIALATLTGQSFGLDGRRDEWLSRRPVLQDPIGDSSGVDIGSVWLEYSDATRRLIGGFSSLSSSAPLILSFGNITGEKGSVASLTVERRYLLSGSEAREWIDGEWKLIDDSMLEVVSTAEGVEWLMDKRQIDQVLGGELWWFRVEAVDPTHTATLDASGTRLFLSDARIADMHLASSSCELPMATSSLRFAEVRGLNVPPVVAQRFFNVYRTAFTNVVSAFGDWGLASSDVLLIVNDRPIDLPTESNTLSESIISVHLDRNDQEDLDNQRYESIYQELVFDISRAFIALSRNSTPMWKEVVAKTLAYATIQSTLGPWSWRTKVNEGHSRFLQGEDPASPLSLESRYARLALPFDTTTERDSFQQITEDKEFAFAELLSRRVSATDVFDAWKAKAEDFVNELSHKSTQDIRDYASGWILDGSFSGDPSFRRENLEDRDYDGLPSYAEALNGASDELGDSDEDGWSDYAEYFHGSDPSSASDHPKGIAADGQFGDWAELFPSAVNVQSTKITNSRCPKSTDIKAYAALKNQKNLIVSVISEQAPQVGDRHGWELEVKGRSIHRIIKQGSSLHRLDVVDPVSKNVVRQFLNAIPSFSKAAEWRLSGQTLQMTDAAFAAEEFRLKLSSVSYAADGVICDTTQWLLPVISDFDG